MNVVELLFLIALGFFVFSRFFSMKLPEDQQKPEAKIIPLKMPKKPEIDIEGLEGMAQIKAADRDFNEKDFIEGATSAFELYHKAITEDDEDMLEDLLSPKLFDQYLEQAERYDEAGEQMAFAIKEVNVEIMDARLSGRTAIIEVKYHARIAQAILDADNVATQGNLEDFQEVTTVWTWARSVDAEDLNWELESIDNVQ